MSDLFKKQMPLTIIFLCGWIIILNVFIEQTTLRYIANELVKWSSIIVGFALVLTLFHSLRHYINVITLKKDVYWQLGIWFMIVLIVTVILGLMDHPFYVSWYDMTVVTILLTMNATTGLYTISASYRAFRVRSIGAFLLTFTAILTMIGNITVGAAIWEGFPLIRSWLQDVSSGSWLRAGGICLGFGGISFGLRVLFGRERGALGEITE